MLYYRQSVTPGGIAICLLIVVIQTLLALGIGLIGSALNVFYRDVRHIVNLGLQIWFYATPIIYPVTTVPERLRDWYYLNPMAGIVTAYRAALFDQATPWGQLEYPAVCAVVLCAIGAWFFKNVEFQFADVL